MSSWLAGIIGMYVGSALGILMISIVSVPRQTERENEIYREGFAEGHRIGLRKGKVLKIDAVLYEELKARASEHVDTPPGNDSVRASTDRFNNAKQAEEHDRVKHSVDDQEDPHGAPAIRASDFVLHKPTGEEWVVAGTNGKDLIPCGYPFPSLAKLEDCELIKSRNIPQPEDVKRALREHGLISFIEGDPQESEAKP